MKRRFEQSIHFPDWAPEELLKLVLRSSECEQVACPQALHPLLLDGFTELSNLEHFGNAVRTQRVYLHLKLSNADLWRHDTFHLPFVVVVVVVVVVPLWHTDRATPSQSLPTW